MSQVHSPIQHTDLTTKALIEHALSRNEGVLSANQALSVETGHRTGRSPKDRFIVDDALTHDTVDWGPVNQPFSTEKFTALWEKAQAYLDDKEQFVANLRVGADDALYVPVKVMTEYAWHSLFVHHLFIRERDPGHVAPWTMLNVPSYKLDPSADGTNSDGAVLINFSQRRVLLCGMRYAGEMKKSMFSVLNFLLTEQDVLPMHCAANADEQGNVALFFGLSGTGKTTLSADPERRLIGDDEHGWGPNGVFNFEGGCYAKCIDLSQEREPVIWNAVRDGAIMENVVLDQEGVPDYSDDRLTQNTRAAYPREHIPLRVMSNQAGNPNAVLFLTCDLYGVLPPIARLTKEQAAYYFLSGYTALVGSTEMGGSQGVKPTFSRCFGAPFFPRPAQIYADLLMKRIRETGANVYLVNTGWTGGAYGAGGARFDIPTTRAVVRAAVTGALDQASWETVAHFGFEVPQQIEGVDSTVLNPVNAWKDAALFESNVQALIRQFNENFTQYHVSEDIIAAGPHAE